MSVFAGKYTYKGLDITFWLTPKTIKATIFKANSLILVKRFNVRNSTSNSYMKLKKRAIEYINGKKIMSKKSQRGGLRNPPGGRPKKNKHTRQTLILDCTPEEAKRIKAAFTTRQRAEILLELIGLPEI